MISYEIERIPIKRATEMVVAYHYLHRAAPAMFAFGLFDGLDMLGCIIYGKPASPTLCVGVCGSNESKSVIELTRLWIQDDTPKNTESFFIGKTLKMLPSQYDIIVAYAQQDVGHVGTIYQATNWLYTGLTARHILWRIDGQDTKHSRHFGDEHGGLKKAKAFYGDRLESYERSRKYRYVILRGSKSRRKQLLDKLKYPILPYPKHLSDTKRI